MRKSLSVSRIFSLFSFLLLILVMVSISGAHAQNRKDVTVYLKSGDVIFGRVLSQDSLGNYRISNSCGITLLTSGEIEHMEKGGYSRPDLKNSGYYNQSSIALLFGEGADGFQPKPSLTMVNGWQWGQRFFAGLGVGYEHYDRGVMPLFAETKYMFGTESFSPFLSFRIGYAFPVEKQEQTDYYGNVTETYGGILLNPEAGIRIDVGSKSSFIAGIGYNYQELSYKETYSMWGSYDKTVFTNFNRISVRLGFIFQ
ncbi:MAG: hypothetical protein IPH20_21990 [Bacteroidales bacterium]|nr:hypothetical protein [Bacteroidales bacterium]